MQQYLVNLQLPCELAEHQIKLLKECRLCTNEDPVSATIANGEPPHNVTFPPRSLLLKTVDDCHLTTFPHCEKHTLISIIIQSKVTPTNVDQPGNNQFPACDFRPQPFAHLLPKANWQPIT